MFYLVTKRSFHRYIPTDFENSEIYFVKTKSYIISTFGQYFEQYPFQFTPREESNYSEIYIYKFLSYSIEHLFSDLLPFYLYEDFP